MDIYERHPDRMGAMQYLLTELRTRDTTEHITIGQSKVISLPIQQSTANMISTLQGKFNV
jgi:hypothetical protein